jgi:DNA-binding transcriptional MerR regulator
MTQVELSIGQVAERTGLSVHTLRFYEREGLFADPVRRRPDGRRIYREDDVDWLTVCIVLRASGMPLPVIRRYTQLVREGPGNEAERLTLLREHRTRVDTQIQELTKCQDLVNYKIGIYEDVIERADADHPGQRSAQRGIEAGASGRVPPR